MDNKNKIDQIFFTELVKRIVPFTTPSFEVVRVKEIPSLPLGGRVWDAFDKEFYNCVIYIYFKVFKVEAVYDIEIATPYGSYRISHLPEEIGRPDAVLLLDKNSILYHE